MTQTCFEVWDSPICTCKIKDTFINQMCVCVGMCRDYTDCELGLAGGDSPGGIVWHQIRTVPRTGHYWHFCITIRMMGLDDSEGEEVCEDGRVYICEHRGDRGPKTQLWRCGSPSSMTGRPLGTVGNRLKQNAPTLRHSTELAIINERHWEMPSRECEGDFYRVCCIGKEWQGTMGWVLLGIYGNGKKKKPHSQNK